VFLAVVPHVAQSARAITFAMDVGAALLLVASWSLFVRPRRT
jgi:hypothetical protein